MEEAEFPTEGDALPERVDARFPRPQANTILTAFLNPMPSYLGHQLYLGDLCTLLGI